MDIKYIMQKSRYKFVHDNKAVLYDVTKLSLYKKELSLFIKELYIYNVSLKNLAKETPRPVIKDELLNLAIICSENERFANWIKVHRLLPYKNLSSISGKPQKFFERWSNYLMAYFIIIHNNYSHIYSFMNIKAIEPFTREKKITDTNPEEKDTSSDTLAGLVLKVKANGCYILTSCGTFAFIKNNGDTSMGELCSGQITKERDYFKVTARIFIAVLTLTLITSFYLYNLKGRTVVIQGKLSMTIETNKWDKVITSTALNPTSYDLNKGIKTFNRSLDSVLSSLLEAAVSQNYIDEKSTTVIYISGGTADYPNIEKTKQYIEDNKLSVTINFNGINLSSEEE
ncbi:anti-sigma-I factor RsgI family protein [Clostridium thermarum]|uniref:anti-sigma-I factor RsgI family protein n=1 Tax=Clostridium thermarum TaxID=1716543 RepID=UPI00111E5C5C|nr:hypothetical protein [Clostridium thermarum]